MPTRRQAPPYMRVRRTNRNSGGADDSITKDAIFDDVYGVLYAPEYRERFASDLAKGLPRVPMAPDFHAFADAGNALGELHLSYDTCEEHPLRAQFPAGREATAEQYRLGTRKMRLIDDGETLAVNEHVHLAGIPPEAHQYEVNGRTPLGWLIDRYHVKTDKQSGIVNDPTPGSTVPVISCQRSAESSTSAFGPRRLFGRSPISRTEAPIPSFAGSAASHALTRSAAPTPAKLCSEWPTAP